MAKYIDSGSGEADQDVGHWLDANVAAGIREFRCQFGYFRYSAIQPFADVIRDLAAAGGPVHFVLGSNFGSLIAADAQRALRVATGVHASLTIVSFADAEFHPKTVHIVRADGSITAVVGSSNLTGRGLGQNVEAGVIFDSRDPDPADQLERIRTAIDWWREVASNTAAHLQVAPAVFPIKDDDDLRDLAERGIINLPQPRPPRPNGTVGAGGRGSQLPRRRPTWRPNRKGWEPEIPNLIPVPPNSEEPDGGESSPGSTAPTIGAPAAPVGHGGAQPIGAGTEEVLLMKVQKRRVSEWLPDGTPIGKQLQISMEVHKSSFMRNATVVVSAADESRKAIKYDFRRNKKTGKRVKNLARFEAPEMKEMKVPVARFQWLNANDPGSLDNQILQYEVFDAASGGEGAEIFRKLKEGITSPVVTKLEQLSREMTVLSKSDPVSAQWYRLDSV
jgi:hypothetical protein